MHNKLKMNDIHSTVAVIGLGLIGGSMALDLKRRGFAARTLGVESDPVAAEAARTIGLVDEVVSYEDCIRRADIIVVAVPVGTAVKMVPDILDRISGLCGEEGAGPISGAFARTGSQSDAEEKVSPSGEIPACANASLSASMERSVVRGQEEGAPVREAISSLDSGTSPTGKSLREVSR